jgi:hypothetical protein
MLSIFIASVAYGLLLVFISIRLEHNIKNTVLISLSAIIQIGAGVIFSQFLPNFAKKAGMVKSIIISTSITSIASLCLYKFISFYLWLVIIYALGTSLFNTAITSKHSHDKPCHTIAKSLYYCFSLNFSFVR